MQFPEDSYLEQITLNKDGKTFAEKRNMWKEGKVFEFRSEFYAKEEQEQSTEPTRSPLAEENVIDVESIEPMLVTDDGTK